jgi:hypothetical protein
MITSKVDTQSQHIKQRILNDENLFVNNLEEKNLKGLMANWKAQLNQSLLKETLNLIHVKETKLIKRDLQHGIKVIEESRNALGSSTGFEDIGKKIGLDTANILASRSDVKYNPGYYSNRDKNARNFLI